MVAGLLMLAYCHFCGESLDADRPGVYQYVEGWERRRAQGGTNAVRLPKRLTRYACHSCIEIRVHGLEGQSELFG
jgi:hypothetical protein